MDSPQESPSMRDVQLLVSGTVQGVGFRPFVYRLAQAAGLRGWVLNDAQGVLIRISGPAKRVKDFAGQLLTEAPTAARVELVSELPITPETRALGEGFEIIESTQSKLSISTAVPADLALCKDCLRELLSADDRRHAYPFINCTQCGPRYAIIENLPYDRPRTTMRCFQMCAACQTEYDDPLSRRYHAEPNACPTCGPKIVLLGPSGDIQAKNEEALQRAADAITAGLIVAVKGVGGFHLICDATKEGVIDELRRRKRRDEKPFAVMFPDCDRLRQEVHLDKEGEVLLHSSAAPILLLPRLPGCTIPASIAPGNPWLGVMLPYAPLHVLLLRLFKGPVIATSANLAEEPLCTNELEALKRLQGIADLFLSNDREIVRPVDDSVVRLDSTSKPILLRRARGYAPSPLSLPGNLVDAVLCTGAQMKSTIAIASGAKVVLSPHIGDLENLATQEAFEKSISMLSQLCGSKVDRIACDKHPGYDSTRYAERSGLPTFPVQHHLAHFLACLLEHLHQPDGVLGVIWDGTGYGEDGTIWGGEFLVCHAGIFSRFAHLRRFSLPGGDMAARDARRSAFAMLHEISPQNALEKAGRLGLSQGEAIALGTMIDRKINTARCSSIGRLFDVAALMVGLGRRNSFEGQLPLGVEALAMSPCEETDLFPFDLRPAEDSGCLEADWSTALTHLSGLRLSAADKALAFHRGLALLVVDVARRADIDTVVLSGGCFQNALLLKLTRDALTREGFKVLSHHILPPGDGSIAAGQALGALWGIGSVMIPEKK